LEKFPEKINWRKLSGNPSALHLLEKFPEKINCWEISENPAAISYLEENIKKINFFFLSGNSSIFELDYSTMRTNFEPLAKEIIEFVWHPKRMNKWPEPIFDE
jgi:hypothetical protein